jgi:hypothetical protein
MIKILHMHGNSLTISRAQKRRRDMSIEEGVLDTEEMWAENDQAEILPMGATSRVSPKLLASSVITVPSQFPY